jgi:ParB/RepB/Spo0J family partition protein
MAEVRDIPIGQVRVSTLNTRKNLNAGTEDASVHDLAASIAAQGLLQPVVVRPASDGWELITGQRRLQACTVLGWTAIPAIVRDLDDEQAVAASLVENVQRADMDPLDKARGFQALLETQGTLGAVAKATGITAATIRRYLNLLALPAELQQQVGTGQGAAGVGMMSKLASTFEDPEDMREAYGKIRGFRGTTAEEILKRSDGDPGKLDDLVDRAIAGEFERVRCGTSLDTCPFLPEPLREQVQRLVAAHAQRN